MAEIDGKTVDVNEDGEIWVTETDSRLLTTYAYNEDEDPHKEYPTAMYVWYMTWTDENGDGTADIGITKRIMELDNFPNYKGTFIRINSGSIQRSVYYVTLQNRDYWAYIEWDGGKGYVKAEMLSKWQISSGGGTRTPPAL